MKELKQQIQEAIASFAAGNLANNAIRLLNVLGYESDRTVELSPNTFESLSEYFDIVGRGFDPEKAKVKEWESIDIIFQLTEDDIKKSHSLFETKQYNDKIIESYLFFALSLVGDKYTRGDLVRITREINKLTPMPAMILFKYNNYLTVAVIDRRLHKRESTKDVLEKVTLIKDIQIPSPPLQGGVTEGRGGTHRAHIEILHDLSFVELQDKHRFTNFVELHNAWRKTLDIKELNKKFFRELANWYFWALNNVEFPDDAEKNKDVRNAINVIRMITRLIFIWFMKEKGLIPEDLFNQSKVNEILVGADFKSALDNADTGRFANPPLQKRHSVYYKAIFQNLFFATLNTEMNKDKPVTRKFRGKNKGDGRDQHYMIHNVFRYEDYFVNPHDSLKKYFEDIPFLNGGLFECLDKEIVGVGLVPARAEEGHPQGMPLQKNIIRIDGFSDRKDNPLKVPDYLFFSSEQSVDLNEIYGTRNKAYKVRGLIDILDSYKFTVDENTPIEEEIALDPELLGKVFENLLASYNPETQTTARKQTGSFYTPREIVNYMVDESIIAYLSTKLIAMIPTLGNDEKGLDSRLRHLLAYNDEPHKFTAAEIDLLISAINTLKALDPACGSGAFPMGMLHKLVYILGRLDPDNSKWRELQKQKAIKETEEAYKIGDKEEREKRLLDISEVFENNASDYGRKLYLIENCIFGIDIQPIAVQIAKLRFFISLIVDQRIDLVGAGLKPAHENGQIQNTGRVTNPPLQNRGIRPLPNLETKFVAANTLIGIEKPAQMLLRNPEIDKKEKELKEVRERHFTARTPQTKEKYRKADEKLRAEISELLKNDGFPGETTEKLAKWNPYDQNASADFFDPEWMFGINVGAGHCACPELPCRTTTAKKQGNHRGLPLRNTGADEGGGFDIVIGNPPYGAEIDSVDGLVKNYKYFDRQKNSASFFIELGSSLTTNNGVISYIIPKSLSFSEGWKKTRGLVTHKNRLLSVIDVCKAFEAVLLEQIIICFSKKTSNSVYKFSVGEGWDGEITVRGEGDINLIDRLDILPIYVDNKKQNILNKLQRGSVLLSEVSRTFRGLPFQRKVAKSGQPILRGRNIGRYKIYGDIDTISLSKEILSEKKVTELLKPKIISQNIVAHVMNPYDRIIIMATVDRQGLLTLDTVMNTYLTVDRFALQYVLAILNSQLASWFYYWFVYNRAVRTMHFDKYYIDKLPLKDIDAKAQQPFITLVDQILAAKKKDPNADTSALEKQIDEMVYALYGLTPEEIAIVEGKG